MAGYAALAQGASDMLGSGLSAYFANRESNQAWQRTKAIYKSKYQWTMGDMKAAGLNPILAYQQGGTGGGAVPQSSSPSVQHSNYASSAKEVGLLAQQMRLLNAQERNADADTAKKVAETGGIASQNEQREFYGKLFEKANEVVDKLLERYGPTVEKYGPAVLDALENPKSKVNSGKAAESEIRQRTGRYHQIRRTKNGTVEEWRPGHDLQD